MFDQTLFKKKKIVCLGLLTADMYVHPIEISDLKELVSDTYEIEEFMISVGGDASNQAIALSQLGANVTLLAKTGDDSLGLLMADQIFAKGIKTKQGFVEKGRNTSVSIVCVDKAGQRFFLHKKGNNNIWSLDEIELDFCNMQDAFLSIGSLGGLDGKRKLVPNFLTH